MTMTLTRRGFVKAGGALFVTLAIPAGYFAYTRNAKASDGKPPEPPPTPTPMASWIEIRSDNTILVRTGKAEIGTGMSAYYAQMVAEELRVKPEAITLIMANTDETPDGGFSAGLLNGATNVRKVAAYTYQALLGLAATKLGTSASSLHVENGIVSAGGTGSNGKSISYGDLVQGQHLDLHIPVTGVATKVDPSVWNGIAGMDGLTVAGDPPLKPVSEFKIIGTSHPMPGVPDMITGKTRWSCDVRLPNMMHARMIRPDTVGGTLAEAGTLDERKFPHSEVIKFGNLLAVVSSDEWEAQAAAQDVAAKTKWTSWAGLPGSENLTKTIRAGKFGKPETKGDEAETKAALASGNTKTMFASYEQPYTRHAPIGPYVAVADVKEDGTVTVWTHSSQSQALRARLAHMIDTPIEKVTVKWLEHSGQYGRTTLGGDGAEADAVILSKLMVRPVRVQWTLTEDLAWSTASPGWLSDIKAAIDANGNITALHSAYYSPHQGDPRPLGALLAGKNGGKVEEGGFVATEWAYDKIGHRLEQAYGMPNLGHETDGKPTPSGGLRGNIMRTPGQRQQNFALEMFITEAAAGAHVDQLEYRLRHTSDQRLIDIIRETAKAAGWEARPSPHPSARRTGSDPVTGRGIAIMQRTNAYWVGIAEVAVTPATGVVEVRKFTIGVECGKIINPRQLDRCMKGGLVMGLSEALKEEVTFDRSRVTSTDWSRYKILTMGEMPEIKVVQISRDDKGFGAGGEAPNALAPPAVAAAVFDATGVMPRRIPLTPAFVKTLLGGNTGTQTA
jgi:nicotinate dehydrogenase subunit B